MLTLAEDTDFGLDGLGDANGFISLGAAPRLGSGKPFAALGMPLESARVVAEPVMQNPAPNPPAYGAADIEKLLGEAFGF